MVSPGRFFELIAVRTLHRKEAFAIGTAQDVLRVEVAVFPLQRSVAFRVAVHAAFFRFWFSAVLF